MAYFLRKTQTLRTNNSRILRIKNVKFLLEPHICQNSTVLKHLMPGDNKRSYTLKQTHNF